MPQSPLHAQHAALGARFTDFGGWTMPVQYEGVLAEHHAVRESTGVFDVSHLGRFAVSGSGAADVLRGQLCNDITRIEPGRAQYTMALNDRGGVEDDIIVWWLPDGGFWVMPNGTNFDGILGRFRSAAPGGVEVSALRDLTVVLAVQGPESRGVLESVLGVVPGRFRVVAGEHRGTELWVAGTGYTGEPGAEVAIPVSGADLLLRDLLEAGAVPCGLGARDTLRLEMGYPLWGQDLDAETTPLEAGLDWVVAWDHEFVGRSALEEQRSTGVSKHLVAFTTEGRAIPRHGHRLRTAASEGVVTSGNFSPTLGHGIGMGYLSPPGGDDGGVEVEIRSSWLPVTVVEPPFVRH